MSMLGTTGLNSPTFVGSVGQQQVEQKKMSQEELRKWDENRLHITVNEKAFPDLISTMYADTEMLAQAINGMMHAVFADWFGSKIEIVQNRQLLTTLVFTEDSNKKPGNGQVNALEHVINKDQFGNADNRIAAFNHLASFGKSNIYKITKEGDELLRDVIPNSSINRDTGKVDWNKIMTESAFQQSGLWGSRTCVNIVADLQKVLKIMYGGATSDGGEWQYMVNVGAPINPVVTPFGDTRANKWQLFIMRCNSKDVDEMAREMGYSAGFGNSMNIVTSMPNQ